MAALDVSGLRPLDGSAPAPAPSPPDNSPKLNTNGLKPLDTSGLKPFDPEDQFGGYASVIGRSAAHGLVAGTGQVLKGASMVAGDVAPGETDEDRAAVSAASPPPQPIPERPLYRAGETVEKYADKQFPRTRAEQESITGRVAEGAGNLAPVVATTLLAPEIGIPLGAAQFAAQSAGSSFDEALKNRAEQVRNNAAMSGMTPEDQELAYKHALTDPSNLDAASRAAGHNAIVGGALGVLPLGVILRPVARTAPGLMGWAAAKLQQAAQSGAVFTSVGEAQHYLGQQIAKEYDPTAHYDFDANRVAAELITGGALGTLHPLSQPRAAGADAGADAGAGARGQDQQPGGPGGPTAATWAPTDAWQEVPTDAGSGAAVRAHAREGGLEFKIENGRIYARRKAPALLEGPQGDQVAPAAAASPISEEFPSIEPEGGPPAIPAEAAPATVSPPPGAALDTTGLTPIGGQMAPAAGVDLKVNGAPAPGEPPPIGGRHVLEAMFQDPRSAAEIAAHADAIQAEATTPPPTPGSREAPVALEAPGDVHAGAEQTAQPTPAQAEAGNYKKRHLTWNGLPIAIETEAGQERTGIGSDGKPWSVKSPVPYGYIKGTEGADGDHLDVYLGPNPQSPHVFVVDQVDHRNLAFDEHKAMVGFADEASARAAFHAAFSDGNGPARVGAMRQMTVPEFKTWLAKGNLNKPAEYEDPLKAATAAAKEHGLNTTDAELEAAARNHKVNGTDLTEALFTEVENGALAEDRRGGNLEGGESHGGQAQPEAAHPVGEPSSPAGQRGEVAGQEEARPAAQGVEPGQAERDRGGAVAPELPEHPGLVVQSLETGKRTTIQPPGTKAPAKGKSDWSEVGKNEIGQTLYEDQRGVRSYIENGVRITEPVPIRPTRAGVEVEKPSHKGEWQLASEKEAPSEPSITKSEMDLKTLNQLLDPLIQEQLAKQTPAQREQTRAWVKKQLDTMAKDGAAIAEHCVQVGGRFSVR